MNAEDTMERYNTMEAFALSRQLLWLTVDRGWPLP